MNRTACDVHKLVRIKPEAVACDAKDCSYLRLVDLVSDACRCTHLLAAQVPIASETGTNGGRRAPLWDLRKQVVLLIESA